MHVPNRAHDMSPVSIDSGWSGMNNYNNSGSRSDSPYTPFNNGDSISPPDSSSSNLPPHHRQNGFGPPPMDGDRRRPSDTGSRNSSRAVSVANSRSSDGTISDQQSKKYRKMEAELHQHYTVLRAYLRGGSQQPPRPNKARDKLLRLSPIQFHELSTDVFDELQRRQALAPLPGRPPRRDNVPPFLQPRPDFHEKRNQARQKLSSLQTPRFRDLSTDVFCELERRFPQFIRPDGRPQSRGGPGSGRPPNFMPPPRTHSSGQSISSQGGHHRKGSMNGMSNYGDGSNAEYGRPMPRQFQSSTITPNKSTMVEDEDEMHGVDSRYDRSSDAFGLESALASPRSDRDTSATSQSIGSGGPYGKPSPTQMTELQEEVNQLKEQLKAKEDEVEEQREEAETENKTLKEQVRQQSNVERDLRSELEEMRRAASSGRGDPEVKQENERLQEKLKKQQDIIDDVRKQGQLHLEEMRAMADSGSGSFEREDKLQADVQRLEEELKEWKAKYVRAKTQLRSVRASSLGLSIARPDISKGARDGALYDEAGAVKDVHITKFQISIDELLRIARSEPSAVLEHMKTVVLAVRNITTDIEQSATAVKDEDVAKKRHKLKGKVSATANNVITASKNYAAAGGLSPVSLVDAAASHLTTAVVDLVKTVKIKPTPPGELEDDDDGAKTPMQSNGYFNIADSMRRRSGVDSIYSALSDQEHTNGSGPGPGMHRRSGSHHKSGGLTNGLGIKPGFGLRQEDSELEDLKVSQLLPHVVSSTNSRSSTWKNNRISSSNQSRS